MTTPTPDQPRPDAAAMPTAREAIIDAIWTSQTGNKQVDRTFAGPRADAVLDALAEAGFVIVSRRLAQYAKFDPKALHREGLFDDALALQSVLAARQGEEQS